MAQTTTTQPTTTAARPEKFPVDTQFALREYFGPIFPPGMSEDLILQFGKGVLCVAGADGQITDREWAYYFGMARNYAPHHVVDRIKGFDFKTARFEEVFNADLRPMAKLLLFESIRVARADGFAERERAAAVKAAKMLGLDPQLVNSIEGLLGIEDAMRQARANILAPEIATR
jgi:hypothetical protein